MANQRTQGPAVLNGLIAGGNSSITRTQQTQGSPSGSARRQGGPRTGLAAGDSSLLTQPLNQRLLTYALAMAGAVTMSSVASAEIVFTEKYVSLNSGPIEIDLDNDGSRDFIVDATNSIESSYERHGSLRVLGSGNQARAVLMRQLGDTDWAAAAPSGARVGADSPQPFLDVRSNTLPMARGDCSYPLPCKSIGPWKNVANRFLGFRFEINGEVHYGWARFAAGVKLYRYEMMRAKLTGYAYETEPNKTILAGDRGFAPDADVSGNPEGACLEGDRELQPASLGLLSLGSVSLDAWRTKRDLKSESLP